MGPGGKEKEWTNCVAEHRRVFGITADWSIGFVRESMRRGLQVCGRAGEGRGKGARKDREAEQ